MPRLVAWLAVVAWLMAPARVHAQPRLVTINGIAFDSLRNEPLEGAFITVSPATGTGRPRSAVSDRLGRFRVDSLPAGTWLFAMQHAVLDSLGLSAATARWTIADGAEEVRVAVPSFRTFWRSVCGGEPPARDTGFVYGTVRQSDGRTPARGATVEAAWLDIVNRSSAGDVDIFQRRWTRDTESEADGSYGICGIPAEATLRLAAVRDSAASGVIELLGSAGLVRRRDLVLGSQDTANAPRGTVTGLVSDSSGAPLEGVRVVTDGAPPARTDADGRFTLGRVPTGTRQVEFLMVGRVPHSMVVDVVANETVSLVAQLRRVNTLDVVRVVGSADAARRVREIEERKQSGLGYVRDSTDIPQNATPSALYAMLPSVQVHSTGNGARRFVISLPSNRGGRCLATVFVDGVRQVDQELLGILSNDEIGAVEVYPRPAAAPPQFQGGAGGGQTVCGAVAVWTKRALWR
jgi:hypothetical protein